MSIAVSTLAHHSRTNIEGEHASIDEEKRGSVRFDVDVAPRASSKPLPHGFSSRAHLFPFQEILGEKRRNPGREREREREKKKRDIDASPQRRERQSVRYGRFRGSHGFREGRARGGDRGGRRLDGKHS
tara:strand:- start:26 stop:412 length:387 start_codon:yes stop_codon:yes gene_type:complete